MFCVHWAVGVYRGVYVFMFQLGQLSFHIWHVFISFCSILSLSKSNDYCTSMEIRWNVMFLVFHSLHCLGLELTWSQWLEGLCTSKIKVFLFVLIFVVPVLEHPGVLRWKTRIRIYLIKVPVLLSNYVAWEQTTYLFFSEDWIESEIGLSVTLCKGVDYISVYSTATDFVMRQAGRWTTFIHFYYLNYFH